VKRLLIPVKIVPGMTYNVFGGTVNLAQSTINSRVLQSSAEYK